MSENPNAVKPNSIKELTVAIKNSMEGTFRSLYIEAELENFNVSGRHAYLTLKDKNEDIRISGVIWSYQEKVMAWARAQHIDPAVIIQGQCNVELFGSINVWEKNNSYRFNVENLRVMDKEAREKQLFEEKMRYIEQHGWDQRKKPVPQLPLRIGFVSSSKAAGLGDVIKTFHEHRTDIEFIIYECNVQGIKAPASIVQAINRANQENRVDLLLVTRGGGDKVDLAVFNEMEVVQAIAFSSLPIVTALGHDQDYHLADKVADVYFRTPTAAAEFFCKKRFELRQKVTQWGAWLNKWKLDVFAEIDQLKAYYEARCTAVSPENILKLHQQKQLEGQQRLTNLVSHYLAQVFHVQEVRKNVLQRVEASLQNYIAHQQAQVQHNLVRVRQAVYAHNNPLLLQQKLQAAEVRLEQLVRDFAQQQQNLLELRHSKLDSYNPYAILQQGYAYVTDMQGTILDSLEQLSPQQTVQIHFQNGIAQVEVRSLLPKSSSTEE